MALPLLTALVLVLSTLGATVQAAQVIVQLPRDAALRVIDDLPPPEGPRIECPPKCVYVSPGKNIDLLGGLRVEQELDPRNGARPWDILAMPGCRGTSALPADTGKCILPFEGNVTISFEVRYRPILAVTFGGTYGGPLQLFVSGNAGPNYMGSGDSFSCSLVAPDVSQCSAHLSAGQPVQVDSPSSDRATLVSRSGPCAGQPQLCVFTLTEDTCIAHLYANMSLPPTIPVSGPECPTGPGVGGGGGGGGGGGPSPEEVAFQDIKDQALAQMRRKLKQALGPCGAVATGLSLFAFPNPIIGPVFGTIITAVATPVCAIFVHRLIELRKIYDDPPDFDFDTIAPITPSARPAVDLPSCDGLTGADRRACRRLGKAALRYLGKVQRADDVTEALRITVERASAALQADEDRALKRQLRAAGKRQKQLEAALAARAKAGAKLASILSGVGATGALSEARFTEAATFVLGKLAEQGLPEAEARTLLGPALTPAALDLLVVLGEP